MRYYISLTAVFGILFLTTACRQQSAPTTTETANTGSVQTPKPTLTETAKTVSTPDADDPLADVPRISLADAKKAFDAGDVVFVDTRGEAQYQNEHLKGAINIPSEAFPTRYKEVPKGKKIVAYCS